MMLVPLFTNKYKGKKKREHGELQLLVEAFKNEEWHKVSVNDFIHSSSIKPFPWESMSLNPEQQEAEKRKANIQKASGWLYKNQISKAINSLTNTGEMKISDEVCNKIQSLHPTANQEEMNTIDLLPSRIDAPHIEVTVDIIRTQITLLRNFAAPGLDMYSSEILKMLIGRGDDQTSEADRALEIIRFIVNQLVNSELHSSAINCIQGLQLFPIAKPKSNSVRPIVPPEMFDKIAEKILNEHTRNAAATTMKGTQYGVSTKFGAEIVIHSFQHKIDHLALPTCTTDLNAEPTDAVTMDQSNAFNSFARSQLFQIVP